MLRKIGSTFFGSCVPRDRKESAKAIILAIKDSPLAILRERFTSKSLKVRTNSGLTPVLAACQYGRSDVLAWLVQECDQSLYIRDNNGNGPVEHAIANGKYDIIQQLYLPTEAGGLGWTPAKDAALKNFPYDRDVALHVAPTSMMFFCDATPLEADTPLTQIIAVDLISQKQTTYMYSVEFAAGAYGKISWYQHEDQVKLVKTPHSPVWSSFLSNDASQLSLADTYLLPEHTNYAAYIKRVRREYKFLCEANPEFGPYTLQFLQRTNGNALEHTYGIIMSIIPGEHPSRLLKRMSSPLDAAKLLLSITKALDDLHEQRGIIHGDLRDNNILVIPDAENKIVFIDFAFSYRRNKLAVPCKITLKSFDDHIAPERRNHVAVAHTSQDVWSLGVVFRKYEKALGADRFQELLELCPSIELFITISSSNDFRVRRPLSEFIKLLSEEIDEAQRTLRASKR